MSSRTNAEEAIEFKTVPFEVDRQTLELDEAPRSSPVDKGPRSSLEDEALRMSRETEPLGVSLEDEAHEPTESGPAPAELRIALNRPVALASVQAEAQARKLKIASEDTHVGPSGGPPGSTVIR